MQQLPTLKVSTGEPLPTDVYDAELTALKVVPNPYDESREQLQWSFTIRGGEYDGRVVRTYSSLSASPKSKLVAYASVLLGKQFQPDDELPLPELIGKRCRIVVKAEPKKDGSGFYNRIESLLPLRQSATDPFQQ